MTNARDLGGWPVAGGAVACRRVLRGGALTGLTEVGCAELAEIGGRTIVDLRDQASQDAAPPPACATRVATHRPAPMPKLVPDTAARFLALLEEPAAIRQAFLALGDADAYPVYLHCEIGRARASVVTALALLVLGAQRQTILEEFLLSNDAGVEVVVGHLEAVLDEIERRGGVEAFLASVGVQPATLAAVRQHVILEP